MKVVKKYTHGCVYAISSEADGVLYVGSTRMSLARRMSMHHGATRAGRTSPVSEWIRRNPGRAIAKVLLPEIPVSELLEAEQRFIEAYRAAGAPLLNVQVTYYDKSP